MGYLKQYALDNLKYQAPQTYHLIDKERISERITTDELSATKLVRRLRDDVLAFKSGSGDPTDWDLQLVAHINTTEEEVDSQVENQFPFPFDRDDYEIIAKALKLPDIWPHHFRMKHAVPLVVQEHGTTMDIILQTPTYPDFFVSMALSFDPKTRESRGYLHLVILNEANRTFDRTLHGMAYLAAHPLLLPAVLYYVLDRHCRGIILDVERKMEKFLQGPPYAENKESLSKLLNEVVRQHTRLTRSVFTITSSIGANFMEELSKLDGKHNIPTEITFELREFVLATTLGTKSRLIERDRLLARIEVQLQVLYNLIAQTTADRALEDNKNSIKIASYGQAISVVALIFLPVTAVAAVFSMGPFFSTEGDRLQVSGDIWIYFVATALLTLLIIVAWIWYTKRGAFCAFFRTALRLKIRLNRSHGAGVADLEEGQVQVAKMQ